VDVFDDLGERLALHVSPIHTAQRTHSTLTKLCSPPQKAIYCICRSNAVAIVVELLRITAELSVKK